MSTSMNNMHSQ